VTIFDPTKVGWLGQKLRRIDWVLFATLREPRKLLAILKTKLNRALRPGDPNLYVGRIAERYAIEGIDDLALRRRLEARGLQVAVHRRYYDARLAAIRWLFRLLRRPSAFHFVIQKISVGQPSPSA
jgi:hypothetical protein